MKRYLINNELKRSIRKSGYSLRQIRQKLGFEVKNIYYRNLSINENHLKKLEEMLNLKIKLKEIKFDYVKNLGKYAYSEPVKPIRKNKELAEFIGIILGDGSVYKNTLNITFDKRNTNYIEYVNNLFKETFNLKFKKRINPKRNEAHLYYYNQNLIKRLVKLGLKKGDKIKSQVGIPNWIKNNKLYSKRCIGGLIDTDGCIYFCKREKHIYIKFTNFNQQLLDDFKEVTKNLGYSFAKANKRNACLYRKDEVVRFINDIQPCKANGVIYNP
ncbi:MAG: hypothetical protein KJ623_01270 [Nanoarchaeota archaeon]|nr:hypothetical protein [Nanoarchaeota archaeon]MBU0962730.1 hypothetical protein [Nanoarchaeota archaeon]